MVFRVRFRYAAAVLLMAVTAISAAAQPTPGSILGVTPTGRVDPDRIRGMAEPLFDHWEVPALPRSVDTYHIYYSTRDADGSPARILAQLFVPVFDETADRPVLVFGSGTTGVGDQCAPSLERPIARRWGHYRANMLSYASQGIITIFPDYLGFNDLERPQRYFSKDAEAHTMLDAARAVGNFLASRNSPVQPSEHLFTSGYSQGGHAAFAAADLRQDYAPELPLTGVIGFAATTDVETRSHDPHRQEQV
ncbi:MAG: lipase family protein, partial [Spirochaetota bacterium]